MNESWSIKFDNEEFDQFLFATGDQVKWLITNKDQVLGKHFNETAKRIEQSSLHGEPYMAKWMKRENHKQDPWISITDF